jgi:hypothetical protein
MAEPRGPAPEPNAPDTGKSPAALLTAIAAFLTAIAGGYVAIREPNAQKISDASETLSKANAADHDELVKLIQAVDDLSKNSDQNHTSLETLRTYLDNRLSDLQREVLTVPGAIRSPATAAAAAPAPHAPALRPVAIPTAPPKPPLWNANQQMLIKQ